MDKQTLEYKCPNCGGRLEFESSTQKMTCPFCDSEIDVEALREFDKKLNRENDQPQADFSGNGEFLDDENISVYVCESCGGEIIAEKTTAAMHCPYCDNPVIFTGKLSGALKPDWVIPFKLSKEDAKKQLQSHLKGKPLLPKVFKSQNHIDEIKAVYVPFWLYDATVDGSFTYEGTKVRTWSDSKYAYTETSHFSIERDGSLAFEHIPADGSVKVPDDLMESIEPFDFSQAVDFQTAYLSGYLADKYDVSAEQNNPRVQQRMQESLSNALKSTISGFGSVKEIDEVCSFRDASVRYALYPVYFLNTSWNGQKYVFAMNGQTGKFVGDLPTSKGRFFAYLAGITAGCSAAAGLIIWLVTNYPGLGG